MASLTVRQLDERLKRLLRLRAARSGRSVEDEVRTILRAAAEDGGDELMQSFMRPPKGRRTAPAAQAEQNRVLLIVGGGLAAYKSLDLIRRLQERGFSLRCILTAAAQHFVTPLSAGAILGERVHTDLFDPASEFDVGHIRLARECDLVVVAPATADLMAKMANGLADDLATAALLATGAKILLAPAMNPHMWAHKATQRNLAQLIADGVTLVGPNEGEMAEAGERGLGRMAEPLEIAVALEKLRGERAPQPLKGKRVLVTSGPTHEPIDPVRYIANRSSGKQGHAIAVAAAAAGAEVTLISGPVNLPDPPDVTVLHLESARDMLAAAERALPVDVAIFAAAVADWRVAQTGGQKIKKAPGEPAPA
ncbi:MAG: bifunctional phosphopantothenoylcysteine decarboxylase/phosphopantothenate--cysteine ligase CoaBC, partial [Pseudolabrys sp.]